MGLYLVTGNQGKLREFRQILGVPVEGIKIDLPEYQIMNPQEVCYFKAKEAANKLNKTILVDDTGLHFNALNGLPGAYIKEFIQRLKPEQICKMLDGFDDKSCYAISSIGYCKPGEEPQIFVGQVDGTVVYPRGESGFGFDSIFQPKGMDKTYAEMSEEEKNTLSHRKIALEEMRKTILQ